LQLLGFLTARNLPTARNEAPEGYVDRLKPNQDHHEVLDTDELMSMDYTPTKKNPPIHN
jgi:hypothetical protein